MTAPGKEPPLDRKDLEYLVHKISNLVSAIYAFGEPACESGAGMKEALEEILAAGEALEETLRRLKRVLREEGEGGSG